MKMNLRRTRQSCWLLLCLLIWVQAEEIPPEVFSYVKIEQLPTITNQSPSTLVAFPFDEEFQIKCEAKGNPKPIFWWKRNGEEYDPLSDPRVTAQKNSGTFTIYNNGNLTSFQGKYSCYASNKLGTAVSEETEFIIPNVPKFPKEKLEPIVVEEGESVVLHCNPPDGIPPLNIYWMTLDLQHIPLDERVSVGLNGDLYFANVEDKDSRNDYCCFAGFPRIRTIVQKMPMALVVNSSNSIKQRKPSFLKPSLNDSSHIIMLKGETVLLECVPAGLPTPLVEWIKVDGRMPTDRATEENFGKMLRLDQVSEEDNGIFRCIAKNDVGKATYDFYLTVEEPPRWKIKPESKTYTIGSSADLLCEAFGKPEPVITWEMNGIPIEQLTPSFRHKISQGKIELHNLQQHESAVFQCAASNKHGTILANANINVLNIHPIMMTADEVKYNTVAGNSVFMDCRVFGSPVPVISWTREDDIYSVESLRHNVFENGTLEIKNTSKEDSGTYICLATNSLGKEAITAVLNIRDSTKVVVLPVNQSALRSSLAELRCDVKYDITLQHAFTLIWEKDGEELDVTSTDHRNRFSVKDGVLYIRNVSLDDEGVYACIASTPLDMASARALLTVLDVPDPPEHLKLSDSQNQSIRLTWKQGSHHNSRITECIIEYEENRWEPGRWHEMERVPGIQSSVLLTLTPHVSYRFRVIAVNAIGKSKPSQPSARHLTPPAAPDRNPDNVRGEGHNPHEMTIKWQPLKPVEWNGPGLFYKVSWRLGGSNDSWEEVSVRQHSHTVKHAPTFQLYDIKVQAVNDLGPGPEPQVKHGFSGEDVPLEAPQKVSVDIINSTLIKVSWSKVPKESIRGHLRGYKITYWKVQHSHDGKRSHSDKYFLTFEGDRNHGMVPGLDPFSEYFLTIMILNGRGSGPESQPVTFSTPEGVPSPPDILELALISKDAVTLSWRPPVTPNGIVTHYHLQYQLINDTDEIGELVGIQLPNPDTLQWDISDLKSNSKYKFYLRACTVVGCSKPATEEGITTIQQVPVLLNITSSVSDTSANISWTPGMGKTDLEFYIAYMKTRKGMWKISDALNVAKNFHTIEGLEPGTEYTIRVMTKNWVDNTSIFEDVIETRGRAYGSASQGISTQGWFIGLMCATALLTIILLILCFVTRNKGGKYSVKEKEDMHPDLESPSLKDEIFGEYSIPKWNGLRKTQQYTESIKNRISINSDNDEKPLKGSLQSLNGDLKPAESADSLIDYGDADHGQFNEDGSFIGEYAGKKDRGSAEGNRSSLIMSQANA
ncbi:neural cell adhesion molecule L1-like protein isoform X3 [Protopterus annectens]|uniref:neural cell adhesion molecule L1-like protein isoform X3 n=1 Tax=Protopterus annectens TaxID=7888 RepID=UPI001CFA8C4D|nr:neural cell adhesion molecule L1-like protein isoform X3 [Protopterus annectens]